MTVTTTVPVRRLSIEDVIAMSDAGILDATPRVELIEGVLVEMHPVAPRHEQLVTRLTMHFAPPAAGRYEVHVQGSLATSAESFVMPDLSVTEPVPGGELPRTALLVVEVAHSSHARDVEKAETYARAGVKTYWIVDALAQSVRVHRVPSGGSYGYIFDHTTGTMSSDVDGVPPLDLDTFFAP